jgi:hypothetical protein
MLDAMCVKVVNNKVVEGDCTAERIAKQPKPSYIKTSDRKSQHLIDIGVDMSKYHPKVVSALVGGGKSVVPDSLRPQILAFALDCVSKHFVPSMFGYGTKLVEIIKTITEKPTRTYTKKVAVSEQEIKNVLDDIQECIEENELEEALDLLKRNKAIIPVKIFNEMFKVLS